MPNSPHSPTLFTEGNAAALKHGAFSAAVFSPLAKDLAAALAEARPDLAVYGHAIAAWAEAEARAALLRDHVQQRGLIDGRGKVREGSLTWLASFERLADQARRRLGLDPLSDADLRRARADAAHSTIDLEALAARGRKLREQHA